MKKFAVVLAFVLSVYTFGSGEVSPISAVDVLKCGSGLALGEKLEPTALIESVTAVDPVLAGRSFDLSAWNDEQKRILFGKLSSLTVRAKYLRIVEGHGPMKFRFIDSRIEDNQMASSGFLPHPYGEVLSIIIESLLAGAPETSKERSMGVDSRIIQPGRRYDSSQLDTPTKRGFVVNGLMRYGVACKFTLVGKGISLNEHVEVIGVVTGILDGDDDPWFGIAIPLFRLNGQNLALDRIVTVEVIDHYELSTGRPPPPSYGW